MKRLLITKTPFFFALVAVAAAAVACTVETTSTPDGSSSSSSSSGGAGGDGGASSSSSSSSSGGTTGDAKIGTITMSQTSFSVANTNIDNYMVFASFAAATGGTGTTGGSNPCTTSKDGACTVSECTLSQSDAGTTPAGDGGAGGKALNAGDIAVSATLDVTLSPDTANGTYPAKTGQVKLFASEEDIDIDAKGNDVPAFKTTLKAPTFVTLTAPTWPAAGQPLNVNRANPLELKWDAGTSGDVMVSLSTVDTAKIATVSCTFKSSDGAGTVPASALGKLLTTGNASISVSSQATQTVEAGDWKVNVLATSPAKAGSSLASGTMKVQ